MSFLVKDGVRSGGGILISVLIKWSGHVSVILSFRRNTEHHKKDN
jgi:hypothetical protein